MCTITKIVDARFTFIINDIWKKNLTLYLLDLYYLRCFNARFGYQNLYLLSYHMMWFNAMCNHLTNFNCLCIKYHKFDEF